MSVSNNKTKFIVIGIICLIVAMFVVLLALGMIGGAFYYQMGGN